LRRRSGSQLKQPPRPSNRQVRPRSTSWPDAVVRLAEGGPIGIAFGLFVVSAIHQNPWTEGGLAAVGVIVLIWGLRQGYYPHPEAKGITPHSEADTHAEDKEYHLRFGRWLTYFGIILLLPLLFLLIIASIVSFPPTELQFVGLRIVASVVPAVCAFILPKFFGLRHANSIGFSTALAIFVLVYFVFNPIQIVTTPPPKLGTISSATSTAPYASANNPAPATPPPSPTKTVDICHGELRWVCNQHPYTVFEQCSDSNGVSGADPRISCQRECGRPLGIKSCEVVSNAPPIGGNHCGYSWFRLTCY
jgi:hypothetical protein